MRTPDLATLCEYGDALRRAGHGEDAQAVLLCAAARARAIGNKALFARAAFRQQLILPGLLIGAPSRPAAAVFVDPQVSHRRGGPG